MRPALLILALIALSGCASTLRPPVTAVAVEAPQAVAAWGRVLARHVDTEGRTDFRALAADRADLDQTLAWIAATNPKTISDPAERLAFLINAYNALAMGMVIERDFPEALDSLWARAQFFYFAGVVVGGETTSLLAFENDQIRAEGDPRIHFAINCMARSCPRLPQAPFTAATLETMLDREARFFFSEARNLAIDPARREVRVSEILKFFTEDFLAQSPSLVAYINLYVDPDIPADYAVHFIDYDWTINAQPDPSS